jgi:hypothetical protein
MSHELPRIQQGLDLLKLKNYADDLMEQRNGIIEKYQLKNEDEEGEDYSDIDRGLLVHISKELKAVRENIDSEEKLLK